MGRRRTHNLEGWQRLRLDRNGTTALYVQVANVLRHRIATNAMLPQSQVPSVREMAAFADVTPATIAKAYRLLQIEGLLEAVPGSGTVVADVRHIEHEARTLAREALNRAVDQAITSLLEMQFDPDEILDAVERRLKASEVRRVVVIALARNVAEKYAGVVQEALTGRYEVQPLVLSAIEAKEPSAIAALRRADRCVTLLSLHQAVKELVSYFEVPVSILLTHLSLETLEALEELSGDESLRVGVVAEEYYRPSIVATVFQYFAQERVLVVDDLSPPGLLDQLRGVDLVVHTLGTQEAVSAAVVERPRTLELRFEPRQDSLQRLIQYMETDAGEGRSEFAVGHHDPLVTSGR